MHRQESNVPLPINYPSILESWTVYRKEVFGESMQDIYQYLEDITGKKQDRANFLRYRKLERSAPDILLRIIQLDMEGFMSWLLKRCDLDATPEQIEFLSYALGMPVKK
jgi:hypothetical protein